jgi:hypothetical protein
VRGSLDTEPGWVTAEIDPEDTIRYRTEFPLRDDVTVAASERRAP